jgi:hypothetical protein
MPGSSPFTYSDSRGQRRLRDYVKVTLLILLLIVASSLVGYYYRYQLVSEMMVEPRPLVWDAVAPEAEQPIASLTGAEECPSNPAEWTLTTNSFAPAGNLTGLAPACVYDRLERTAAWFYATSVLGYSRQEAATLLGMPAIPMYYSLYSGGITVLTDFKDEPQNVNLRFPNNHPDLREWRIDDGGSPAVEMSFAGCFRTSSMIGGNVSSWGEGFPIVCQYFSDLRIRYLVSAVNGRIVTISGSQNFRRPMWFGYGGGGHWIFLGDAPDWNVDLSQIPNLGVSTIHSTTLLEKYGIPPVPLPANWQAYTGQDDVDAFLTELDRSVGSTR